MFMCARCIGGVKKRAIMGTDWLKVVACFPVSAGREASTGDLRLEKKKKNKRKDYSFTLLVKWW